MTDQERLRTVGLDELTFSNMLTLNALIELLDERGLLTKQDVLTRVKRLQEEMTHKRRTH